jgi:hypothetical protein
VSAGTARLVAKLSRKRRDSSRTAPNFHRWTLWLAVFRDFDRARIVEDIGGDVAR